MGNMNYCRFENTASDLRDCMDSEGMYDETVLSESEQRARKRLIQLCVDITADVGHEVED